MLQSRGEEKGLRCLDTEIIRTAREIGIIAGEVNSRSLAMTHFDLIGELERGHQGFKFMKPIGTPPQNPERKIDLGGCGE
jgi:hypothetical protein